MTTYKYLHISLVQNQISQKYSYQVGNKIGLGLPISGIQNNAGSSILLFKKYILLILHFQFRNNELKNFSRTSMKILNLLFC